MMGVKELMYVEYKFSLLAIFTNSKAESWKENKFSVVFELSKGIRW